MLQKYCSTLAINIDRQHAGRIAGSACRYKFATGNVILLRLREYSLISTRIIEWQYYRLSPVASCSLPIAPAWEPPKSKNMRPCVNAGHRREIIVRGLLFRPVWLNTLRFYFETDITACILYYRDMRCVFKSRVFRVEKRAFEPFKIKIETPRTRRLARTRSLGGRDGLDGATGTSLENGTGSVRSILSYLCVRDNTRRRLMDNREPRLPACTTAVD